MSEEFNRERRRFLAAAAMTFAAAHLSVNCCGVQRMTREDIQLPFDVLQHAVPIHPTVSELIPTVLGEMRPVEDAASK